MWEENEKLPSQQGRQILKKTKHGRQLGGKFRGAGKGKGALHMHGTRKIFITSMP